MNMIDIQKAALPFVLIPLTVYIAPSIAVLNMFLSPIFYFEYKFLS